MKPGEPIAQLEIGDYRNFVYLILDWKSHHAAIVDPQEEISEILNQLNQSHFVLDRILLTHTHFDHIAGVEPLLVHFPELPIQVHEKDMGRLPTHIRSNIKLLSDQEKIQIGEIEITVLHTPGHSAGESCFYVNLSPGYLLTGDTVFIRDCGRTDLPTGSTREMFQSLQRIKKLPLETIILPGHHYAKECASWLGREMKESPPFLCGNVEELERLP